MIDWTASMQQTFKFYVVDPDTWLNKTELRNIKSCNITFDSEDETLGSASLETTELIDECYVRIVLICIQNGITYDFPLGTFMVQTPETDYNGRVQNISMDAYTPLLELKDKAPPYGYYIREGASILSTAADVIEDNVRVPVVRADVDEALQANFVADYESDTWLTYVSDLIATIGYRFDLDELGRILFAPTQDPNALKPVWIFNDDNSSILLPEIKVTRDLYGIPNVVEVLYSTETGYKLGVARNEDDGSPVSIHNRGREVLYRVTNPEDLVNPSQKQIDNYAEELLRDLSSLEYTLSYSHGYCPVRVGDCVMLNYERAGIRNTRAIVKSQSISCTTGVTVSETATFTKKIWG